MKARLLTAAVGIPLALVILIASVYVPYVFYAAISVLCLIGVYEAVKAAFAGKKNDVKTGVIFALCMIYSAVVMASPLLGDMLLIFGTVMAASLIFLFLMFGVLIRHHALLRIEQLATAMVLTMFVSMPFMVLELIYATVMKNPDGSPSYAGGVVLAAYCLIVAWVADGGAYFVGRALGRHKLAPVISPKKTVEGAVGGFVISLALSLAAPYVYADVLGYAAGRMNYLHLAVISTACVVMSMFGDIAFSAIKRQYGVKDFGNLLPGHGGVLDRFDSVLFVAPTFYLLNHVLPVFATV